MDVRFLNRLINAAVPLCLCATGAQVFAANGRFLVREWTTDDGLPQNVVLSMAQTREGYLYLGTGNGLARFDGVQFKTFEEEQAELLSDSAIVKLFEDSHQNLWIATDNGGVLVVDPQGKRTSVTPGDTAASAPLTTICEDTRGGVWFTTSRGRLYYCLEGAARLVLRECPRVMADGSGTIWIATTNGSLLGGRFETGVSQLSFKQEVHPGGTPEFLLASKDGGYWCLATETQPGEGSQITKGRITKWRGGTLEKDLGEYHWNPRVPVLTACEDLEGNLIVGTWGEGVYWFDAEGNATRVRGLSHDTIWSMVVDREGSLWIGSNGGGLHRVKRQKFDVLAGTETTIQSVSPDAEGGLWIGYHSERVAHWNGTLLQQFTNIVPVFAPPGLGLYVQSVFEDSKHRLWVAGSSTLPEPLCFFRILDGRAELVLGPPALNRNPSAIYEDPKGALWVGTQAGLVCWSNDNWKVQTNRAGLAYWANDSWKVYTTRDGLASDSVKAIAADRAGNLWVGTSRGGLSRLRDGQFTVYRKQAGNGLPSDNVTSLYVDADDVLWIGTASGLARYDHGQWTRFTTREGLASNRIGYLLEDDDGWLWLGSTAGLMRVPKRSLNEVAAGRPATVPCRVFGKADGLPTGECSTGSQPGATRTSDGRLWFPTIKGLVFVQPSELKPNTNAPPVAIEAVRVDGQLQTAETLRVPIPASITIPASKESVEIFFANLNLSAPENGWFRYRLDGREHDWTTAEGQRRYARYSKLPHGRYHFQVMACNEDGLWNQTPASLELIVLPPFWETWWFLTGSTVVLLGIIVGSVSYVSTQRLQRQLAALRQQEALEKERARIARDLHDQLGANLTQVALLGDMAEADKNLPKEVESHARQISQTARETTHALDEIVWTVNPSNDTLDGLVNYICKYAQDYLATAGLKYRLEVPPQLPAVAISPELRHNVFLAAKEAINNIVKHSKASSAWMRLDLQPDWFVVEIEDNGRGVKPADSKKGRNGLRNMRKRMEEVGGQFELTPRPEGGTRVRLTAPLRPAAGAGIDGNGRRH